MAIERLLHCAQSPKKKMQVLLQRPSSLPQESLPVPLSKLQADTLFLLQVPSAGETITAFFLPVWSHGSMEALQRKPVCWSSGGRKKKKSYCGHILSGHINLFFFFFLYFKKVWLHQRHKQSLVCVLDVCQGLTETSSFLEKSLFCLLHLLYFLEIVCK